MHQVTCEGCGQSAPSYEIVRSGSSDGPYRNLCSRCFNMHAAQRAGLEGFEHVRLEPIRMTDSQGATHDFHFRSYLFGPGIALDSFELRDGHPAGYRFRMIGEPEVDLLALLGRLIEKMRRALAVHHIEDTRLGPQIADHQVVRGRVESSSEFDDSGSNAPVVVIDGRDVSWDEFGRMLATFEGWQFKLEMRDMSDEL